MALAGAEGSSGGHSTPPGNCPHPGVPSYPLWTFHCRLWALEHSLHQGGILAFVLFWCGAFLKYFWICYNIASVLCFGFFGQEACRILAPWPEIKPVFPIWKGKISCTGPLGESPGVLALPTLSLLCHCFIPVMEISLLYRLSIGWTTDLSGPIVSFPDSRALNRNYALNRVKC